MKQVQKKTNVHLFICCCYREGDKVSCAGRGSEALVKELKEWTTREELKDFIKVSRSSCLGFCERGMTACLYPHNRWFIDITPSDSKKIAAMLKENINV